MTAAVRARRSEELAGDAWRMLSEMFMARRHRFVEVGDSLDLTPGDLQMLLTLEPGVPRAMRTLAGLLHCDPSNITWLVDRLEERGLVARSAHARDRRVRMVQLTDVGVEAQESAREGLSEAPAELLALEYDDLRELVNILTRVDLPPIDQ